jgi:hypothetical protein
MTPHHISAEPATESPEAKAVRLLTRQLDELETIRTILNDKSPKFLVWRDTTRRYLQRSLGPTSPHLIRFEHLKFYAHVFYAPAALHPSQEIAENAFAFKTACETAEASLTAAISEVTEFGIYTAEAKPALAGRGDDRSGGVTQTFHGPVTIHAQAIATDSAIQKIGHMGDATGASLKEIAALLQQSEDLTPRQVKEGLAGIEGLAVEVEKPEAKRNWKSVLDCGQAVLGIASKATDLGQKLARYTPAIIALVENARHVV